MYFMKQTLFYIISLVVAFSVNINRAWAQDVDDDTPPADGCQYLVIKGFTDSEAEAALEYINQVRMEACLEGVRDPRDGTRHLTINDYVPLQWSTDLERIARVRAVEAYLTRYHNRLNGKSWGSVVSNGVTTSTEDLAFYAGMLSQISSYYAEKSIWVNRGSGVTGHYTSMINPSYKYVGMAEFSNNATIQMTGDDKAGQETIMLDDSGYKAFKVEVKKEYVDGHVLFALKNSSQVFEGIEVYDDASINMYYRAFLKYTNDLGQNRWFYLDEPSGVTFTSSDPTVASIDNEGNLTGHKPGTTTITGMLNGTDPISTEVTCLCHHKYEYGEIDSDKMVNGKCVKCGEEISGKAPTYMYLYWRNSETTPGSSYYGGTPSSNPVGSTIGCWLYDVDGDKGFNDIMVECSDPDLLQTPSTLSGIQQFKVLGSGIVTLTIYSKYNPSLKRTYKITLG